MRITTVFALIFALIALLLTGIFILSTWNPNPGVGLLWKYVSFWPSNIINLFTGVFADPSSFLRLGTFMYICLSVHLGAVVTAGLLAHDLDRPAWDWTIATFFFPWIAPFILAMIKEH